MDALSTAFAKSSTMYANAKASISLPRLDALATGGSMGDTRPMPTGSKELAGHFKNWAWAAIRLIASRAAGQKILVANRPTRPTMTKGAQNLEPLDSHPILDLLADPNDLHVSWGLIFSTVCSLEVCGVGLWWMTSTADGRNQIYQLPPHWLESTNRMRTTFRVRPDGATQAFEIPAEEIVFFSFPDPFDPMGFCSPLARVADAILTDESISTSQRSAFSNGLFPQIILTAGRLPSDPVTKLPGERPVLEGWQRRELVEAIRSIHRGVLNSHEPLILDGMIERIDKLSNSVAEMDFINSGKITKSRVLNSFGVSEILLGETQNANRAASTAADAIFVQNTLNPLLVLLGQCATEWLSPRFSRPNEKLVIWFEPAVADDDELALKRWQTAGQLGYVTANEYRRRLLNLPDIDGGDELIEPAVPLKGFDPYSLASA